MKTRLQRFLADCGVASRRECEALIQSGRVRVNGEVKSQMPVMIEAGKDVITVDDENISVAGAGGDALKTQDKVYFLLNKPKGILVTNSDPANRKTVSELLTGIKERVFPVGRLEMDSRGALLFTNDGEFANRLTHPRFGIEKTYIVEVDGRIGHEDLEKIKKGVWLSPATHVTRMEKPGIGKPGGPAAAIKTERYKVKLVGRERGRSILEIKISEGKNREIRRVMARIGHTVRDLNRVAIAGKITIKNLEVGKFRPLTESEVKWLFKASSPDFHTEQQEATQSWYEAKEMEKERKRLEKEGAQERAEQAAKARAPQLARPRSTPEQERARKESKPRPLRSERKGKKPFIPPTGRNAGKALGGNFIGKQRLVRELEDQRDEMEMDMGPATPSQERDDAPKISSTPRPAHPLGDAAAFDN